MYEAFELILTVAFVVIAGISIYKAIKNKNVEIITIPGNLDTEEWGICAAHCMIDELRERGIIGDEIQYGKPDNG